MSKHRKPTQPPAPGKEWVPIEIEETICSACLEWTSVDGDRVGTHGPGDCKGKGGFACSGSGKRANGSHRIGVRWLQKKIGEVRP